jgi:hypothetical protein
VGSTRGDVDDSCLRLLCLSEQGTQMAQVLQERVHERHKRRFHQLSLSEQTALIDGLSALLHALSNTAK